MWHRLLFGILLAITAYYVVMYFSTENFTPTKATPVYEQEPRGNMTVSSSGPNPPNVSPPPMPSEMSPSPEARDPYDTTVEDADAPEQLRYPERSFSPGLIAKETENNVNAGLAGNPSNSPQAIQQFSSEMVTNGGAFFGSVSANEDESPNYSAF
jgi:hypothetical protein